ncbi:hypothetical protein R6Q57_016427 [Mikania cordata]
MYKTTLSELISIINSNDMDDKQRALNHSSSMGITPATENAALVSTMSYQASGSSSVPYETAFLSFGQVHPVSKVSAEGSSKALVTQESDSYDWSDQVQELEMTLSHAFMAEVEEKRTEVTRSPSQTTSSVSTEVAADNSSSDGSGDGADEIVLFGVRVKVDPLRKSVSMNNLAQYEQPAKRESSNNNLDPSAADNGYASADDAGRNQSRERKRG